MLVLKRVKIKGFRGYTHEKELYFDNPVILLFGENHRGKSSTLNAIEWCLFGDSCIGKDTGIRERIKWEIKNRNLSKNESVVVELELEDESASVYKISRKAVGKTKDEVEIVLPSGEVIKGKDAEEKLAGILKSSFRDFLTTVYQHQEAIRAILTQEPRDRNDAIDRLLGLSDYRNIITGITSAGIDARMKDINKEWDNFKKEVERILMTRERDLESKRKELIQKGIKEEQMSKKGVIEIFESAQKELSAFANEMGIHVAELESAEDLKELKKLTDIVNEKIYNLRAKIPDVERQKELFFERTRINSLISEYNQKIENLKRDNIKLLEFINKNGDESQLEKLKSDIESQIKTKEKEMRRVNAKGKIINDAIDYLREEGIDKNICPVCGKETTDLLNHLQEEWEKKYEGKVGEIKREIETLREKLENTIKLLNMLKSLRENLENRKKAVDELIKEIGEILSREITPKDDPLVLLKNQLLRVEEELKKLEESVRVKQEKLNEIQKKVNQVQLIIDILELEEKKRIVEKIEETPEYKQIENLRDRMSVLVGNVEKIVKVVQRSSNEEAENLVDLVGEKVNDYFRKITNNPAIDEVKLYVNPDKTGKNNYEFKDQDDNDLTPILSQGDLNALALSIFLAMASLKGATSTFGFIILDDPSQSLGSEHKENLVEVLDEVSENKMVILATMDRELQELLTSNLTKAKTKYIFKSWDPNTGPQIERE